MPPVIAEANEAEDRTNRTAAARASVASGSFKTAPNRGLPERRVYTEQIAFVYRKNGSRIALSGQVVQSM